MEDLNYNLWLLNFFKQLWHKDYEDTDELNYCQPTDTVVYQGSKEDIVELLNKEFAIGTVHPKLGEIVRTSLESNNGPIWTLRVTFIKPEAALN